MVTIYKTDNIKKEEEGALIKAELRGLSTDTKPSKVGEQTIDNGSVFIEIDTGKIFFYDLENQEWKEA